MKKIKILTALFIAITAMSSCSNNDTPDSETDETLKTQLYGTWYNQYDATGTINGKTYKSVVEFYQFPEALSGPSLGVWNRYFFAEPTDENPFADLGGGSGSAGVFQYSVSSNGTVSVSLRGLELVELDLSYYQPTERTVTLSGGQLTATGVDGRQFNLLRADEAKEVQLRQWSTFLHGGRGGGEGTAVTDISDTDAYEPSAARALRR